MSKAGRIQTSVLAAITRIIELIYRDLPGCNQEKEDVSAGPSGATRGAGLKLGNWQDRKGPERSPETSSRVFPTAVRIHRQNRRYRSRRAE